MAEPLPGVAELGRRLAVLGWVTDLFVGGSLATGDYVPGVSDLDLVAIADGPVTATRQAELSSVHRQLDDGIGAARKLGCCYVDAAQLCELRALHPTWTHGSLVQRILSGIARAELVRYGYPVVGRSPRTLLPAMSDDDVREAARAELVGAWAQAARRPWWWLNPACADLGLTSMARGRYALANGELLTKSRAVEQIAGPPWLIDQLRARRQGQHLPSPRVRTAWIAWRDARRTVAAARHAGGSE